MWENFYVLMCAGDVAWSVRSRDLIVIINCLLSEGVRGALWFVVESFENDLISAVVLKSYND